MDFKQRLRTYYQLTKPGIIYGNLLTGVAGYVLGSQFQIDWLVFGGFIVGLILTIAGACVTNNYLDRAIDARMQRTSKRALLTGAVSPRQAVIYAALLTGIGLGTLAATQNQLTTLLLAFAWLAYVILYGYSKRHSVHGTLVGCISGSLPLVTGFTASTGDFGIAGVQLFLLMTAWQMAHFYGIAMYRLDDYKAANIPVMPAIYGNRSTQLQSLGYISLFITCALWMVTTQTIAVLAGALLVVLGIIWLYRCVKSITALPPATWGKRSFLFSLTVILGMSLSFIANPLLPL